MTSFFNFLRRNKAYTAIDVFGLAVSFMFIILIGAYTWQETHLDSQHSKLDRMYLLAFDLNGDHSTGNHWRMINKLKNQFPEIESGTAIVRNHRYFLTNDGEQMASNVIFADSTFFDIFDFKLVRGDAHKALTAPNSLVVTEEFGRKVWGDRDPIGETIIYNDQTEPLIVTAVMQPLTNTTLAPKDGSAIDAILPMEMVKYMNSYLYDESMGNATGAEVLLLAKEGFDLTAEAQKYHDFAKDFFWILQLPDVDMRLLVIPFKDHYFSGMRSEGSLERGDAKMVKTLFVVGLVILIFALMNYVNLTVALSAYRAKEMATRRLLGTSRGGIMCKLIGESTMLCLVSFVLGAVMAWLALPLAGKLLSTAIHIAQCITPLTVAVVVAIILIMGLVAGIIPAMLISSVKPIDVVRGTFRRQSKMVFSKVFIVVQNVITIVMIAAAITMHLQIDHVIKAPLGYDPDGIMYIENYGDMAQGREFVKRVEALPCVELVSASCGHPVQGGNNNTMNNEGRTVSLQVFQADSNFMKVFDFKLDRDNHATDARRFYLNHQAMSELGLDDDADDFPYFNTRLPIHGILKDFRIRTILDTQHPVLMIIKDPNREDGFWPWGYLIKVKGDQNDALQQVKEIFKDVYRFDYDGSAPYIDQEIARRFINESNIAAIVAIFAGFAILISLLGLVAMSSYFVQQREREIAVKKVLGCDRGEILRKLVMQFVGYVLLSFVMAVPLIYYLMHQWLSEFSYRISLYWWIYIVAGLLCIVVSILAVFVQSYRAANRNPVKALYQN